jgi:hypothetical protein
LNSKLFLGNFKKHDPLGNNPLDVNDELEL